MLLLTLRSPTAATSKPECLSKPFWQEFSPVRKETVKLAGKGEKNGLARQILLLLFDYAVPANVFAFCILQCGFLSYSPKQF